VYRVKVIAPHPQHRNGQTRHQRQDRKTREQVAAHGAALYRAGHAGMIAAMAEDAEQPNPIPTLPYATPAGEREKRFQLLGLIAFLLGTSAVLVALIGGVSWPTVAIIACLSATCMAFGHFLTSR
jgi:hypothetical protein